MPTYYCQKEDSSMLTKKVIPASILQMIMLSVKSRQDKVITIHFFADGKSTAYFLICPSCSFLSFV